MIRSTNNGVNFQGLRIARQVYMHTPYNELTGAQRESMERRIYAACLLRLKEKKVKAE